MPERGELLAGKYRLVEKIGEGGMGTVWHARNEDLGTDVAVKLLHKVLMGDETACARFRHEARAAARVDHPNICRVIDVGEHEATPFLVMDLLRGESLAARLSREKTLPARAAAEIVAQVLEALVAAHAAQILHRDLKPENVFLSPEDGRDVARILDFGVSKYLGDDAARVKMTRTGALVGTPAYMSPEQAMGLPDIDVRSDVWAVGVLLYESLTGRLPYEATNYNAMLVRIATEPPRGLTEVAPEVDAVLAGVVMAALAPRANERTPDARTMLQSLREWLQGAPISHPRVRVSMPTPRAGTTPMSWAEGTAPTMIDARNPSFSGSTKRSPWLMVSVVGAVLCAGGFLVYRGARSHGGTASAATMGANASGGGPSASSAPATVSEFTVSVVGVPAGASVSVNGEPGRLPVHVSAGRSARIEVAAEGFERWTQTVTPTGDVALTYEGRRVAESAPVEPAVSADAGAASAVAATSGAPTAGNGSSTRGSTAVNGGRTGPRRGATSARGAESSAPGSTHGASTRPMRGGLATESDL